MKIEFLDSLELSFTVPLCLGTAMICSAFERELKSARFIGPRCIARRRIVENTRGAATLYVRLHGKESALPHLREIARRVAREVKR